MSQSRAPAARRIQVPAEWGDLDRTRDLAESLLENPVTRAILEALPGHALILTPDRQVLAGRAALLAELGLAGQDGLRGLEPGDLFHGAAAGDGDDRPRQYRVGRLPLRVGRQDLDLFTFRDVTDQKRRETLDQVFLHDLLNLVGGLEVIAGHLRDGTRDPRACAEGIRDLARQAAEEIQSQRILSSIEAGCLVGENRATRADRILERLNRFFTNSRAAEGRRLEIRPGPAEPFLSNPVLLTRVLVNLVKNALEATPPGGTVTVWHERREGRRGFLVENPGVIPAEVAGRIFELGFSTKGRDRGLGAFGAKYLGERFLGGEVGYAAHPGGRTRFYLWLPERGACPLAPAFTGDPGGVRIDGTTPPAGQAGPDPAGCGPNGCDPAECGPAGAHRPPPADADTVLVVDDSRTLCRLLGGLLCERYRVLTAATGAQGLALALAHRPDLILLDVMMPGLDGFAVCRRLKEDSRTRDIPVLFLTALGGEAEEMRALEAGGIDFILKPVSPPVLAARVRNQLALKHQQDRLRNLSLLDGLTGIANRRRFDQYLEMEWQRCSRSGQPLSLVMGDVDHFKAYNDGYGHGRGDECLRAVARVFGRALRRPADLAARYGGEEFVCLLPETDPEGARIVADQIMAQMAELALPHAFSPVAEQVTVSVGVATAVRPSLARPCRSLVEEADMWLYEAKAHGRNRIEAFGARPPRP